jgi:hypothetical protein
VTLVEFAERERIECRNRLNVPPRYVKRPWLDFTRCWPYTFDRVRGSAPADNLWQPQGREYRPLYQPQDPSSKPYCPAEEPVIWQFVTDPMEIAGVWWSSSGRPGWLYYDNPLSKKDYFQRLDKLITSYTANSHEIIDQLMRGGAAAAVPASTPKAGREVSRPVRPRPRSARALRRIKTVSHTRQHDVEVSR